MKKNLFTTIIAIFMATAVWAQPVQIGTSDVYWEINGTTLEITGSGDMPDFNSGEAPWYSYQASLNSLTMADAITHIGDWAFYNFSNLTTVTMPASLVSIGVAAFLNCSGLTGNIHIPAEVTSI